MGTGNRLLNDGTVAQGIVSLTDTGDIGAQGVIIIPSDCQMLSIAGPTAAGSNQVTKIVDPNANLNGIDLFCFYTQVIQASSPGNITQSLVLAAAVAPTDFNSKNKSCPIFRTFQDEKQASIALGGFAPMNVTKIRIPPNWGIWQIVSITGAALTRNNMRFGLHIR